MVEKDYRRCSENETNHRPVFKKSTFDECRPSRTVFEVDSRGTIESETAIPVTPEEFENTSVRLRN